MSSQKIVVALVLVLAALNALFPPWEASIDVTGVNPRGRIVAWPVWSAPDAATIHRVCLGKEAPGDLSPEARRRFRAWVDSDGALLRLGTLVVIGGAAFLLLSPSRREDER